MNELIRKTKIRFFNKKNKNKRIFITALEQGGIPFNKMPKEIKKSIANDVRQDYLLRGGKDLVKRYLS